MKRSASINNFTAPQPMVMLITLLCFIPGTQVFLVGNPRVSAKAKPSVRLEPLLPQGRTIEIDIRDNQYVPPGRTLKIPPGFKEQGVRFAVRPGDTIKICNSDKFYAKPFSVSKENKFEGLQGPGGLAPGKCITVVVNNSGRDPIRFYLPDEINV